MPENIILTGFMGTGKTTVGRLLSEKLGWPAVDTDHLIEQREGKSIPEIFETLGEEAFRRIETDALQKTLQTDGQIITLGGGAVTREENRAVLKGRGTLICLRAQAGTILDRVGEDQNRPLLAGEDRKQRIESLLSRREEAYQTADHQIDTDHKTPEDIAEEILRLLATE